MKTIKINLRKILQEEADLIANYLKRGLVIAYPTDTVYGLGCDAGNKQAVKKINKIKGERENKPFIWLISDFKMLKKYCSVDEDQERYLKKVWPGQVTVILNGKKSKNGLAVRLPKNDFLIKIISKVGFPLVSTSLNKKGDKPLVSVENLAEYFKHLPDLAVDAGECKNTKPSRLVDIRDIKKIKVLRK